MSRSSSVRVRLRVLGLVATSAVPAAMTGALRLEPSLLRAAHPLPLAGAFLVVAALALPAANWLRGQVA